MHGAVSSLEWGFRVARQHRVRSVLRHLFRRSLCDLARLRDEAPVYFNEKYGFYTLSRHADVVAAHGDPVRFVSSYGVTLELLLQKQPMNTNMMIVMDPPEHTQMRKLVSQAFSRNAIGSLEPLVAEVIAGYLDASGSRAKVDLVAEFAALFPVEVVAAMLGVPEGERQQVRLWVDMFLHREEGNPNTTKRGWRPRCTWRGTSWIWPAPSVANPMVS